ncbi:MAG: hypothetical protein ABR537_04395 [Gemmatimonadales bacterium]
MNALKIPAALFCALLLTGCHGDSIAGLKSLRVVDANATVRYVNLEGGCWVLQTDAGRYEPVNLPSAYAVDGLQVYVELHTEPRMVSACMVAPLVTIETIR